MCSSQQPLAGADSYVPARSVAHSTVDPGCYGCGYGKPCSQACSACGCRWSGDPMSAGDECDASRCICHDEASLECTNCQAITPDIRRFDFGRAGVWEVCGVCADKMEERADAA
jgi:hypothetical protein